MELCSGEIALVLKMFSFFRKKLYVFSWVVILGSTVGPCFMSLASLQLPHFTFILISYKCSFTMMSKSRFLDYTPMTRVTTET
ncbi:hypothetical protein C0J52_22462 [Blattella germanica]|nr:hypothetical protein C0J52_22462 [Blattella germanica]